jgi:hypothetical protein
MANTLRFAASSEIPLLFMISTHCFFSGPGWTLEHPTSVWVWSNYHCFENNQSVTGSAACHFSVTGAELDELDETVGTDMIYPVRPPQV